VSRIMGLEIAAKGRSRETILAAFKRSEDGAVPSPGIASRAEGRGRKY